MRTKILEFRSLLACLAVLFLAAGTAFATFPGHNGLIEFPAPGVCEDDPSFTPDETRIIFHRFDPATNDDAFWSMDLNGDNRQRIGLFGFDPNVSPNGKKISFVCCPNGTPDASALFTSNIDGSNLFQVTPFSFDVAVKQEARILLTAATWL